MKKYGIVKWIKEKKNLEKDLDRIDKADRDFEYQCGLTYDLKEEIKDLKKQISYLEDRQTKYLKTIRELRKKIKLLEKGE